MEYKTIIFNASKDGNLRRLRVFLEGRPHDEAVQLVTVTTHGTPPLVIAARNGHIEVIKYLLSKGADVSQTGVVPYDGENVEGCPCLWAACAAGHFELVKVLVDRGANINQTTKTQSCPLRAACYDGHIDIVEYLIARGANFELANQYGHTCLMIAAFRNHMNVLKALLGAGADPNKTTLRGETALHDACDAGHVEIVKVLLECGAVMRANDAGLTPMLTAASLARADVVDLLEQRQECSDAEKMQSLLLLGATHIDKNRDNAAATECWKRAMQIRQKHIKDMKFDGMQNYWGHPEDQTPVAAYGFRKEVIGERDVDTIANQPEEMSIQALMMRERILGGAHPDTIYYIRYRGAIYADLGEYERCLELWMHALRIQLRCLRSLHCMTLAAFISCAELFAYMLNEHVTAANQNGFANGRLAPSFEAIFSVLQLAVVEVCRGIKEHTNPEDSTGFDQIWFDLLCEYAEKSNDDTRCGEPDHASNCDQTPMVNLRRMCSVVLHLVCLIARLDDRITSKERFKLGQLLYKFVKVDPRDDDGKTLLHMACSADCSSISRFPVCRFPSLSGVQFLIEVGANVDAVDNDGATPLHILMHNTMHRPSIISALLQAGAHPDIRDKNGIKAVDLLSKKVPKSALNSHLNRPLPLKCLAATACVAHQIPVLAYDLPQSLNEFVLKH